jgi:hypothetical protein
MLTAKAKPAHRYIASISFGGGEIQVLTKGDFPAAACEGAHTADGFFTEPHAQPFPAAC